MYEVTVVESRKDVCLMGHFAIEDENIEYEAKQIYAAEQQAYDDGMIESFTIICEFQQFNKVTEYRHPGLLTENK